MVITYKRYLISNGYINQILVLNFYSSTLELKMLLNIALLLNVAGAIATANRPRPFSLPSSNASGRAAAIEKTRQGFQYGTDDTLIGVNPWPSGPLGKKSVKAHYSAFEAAETPVYKHVEEDAAHAQASLNGVSHKHTAGNVDHCRC